MEWGWDWQIKNRVEDIRVRLSVFRNIKSGSLTETQKKEIQTLSEELVKLQESCSHTWQVVQMFTHYRQYCKSCEMENKKYDHWKKKPR